MCCCCLYVFLIAIVLSINLVLFQIAIHFWIRFTTASSDCSRECQRAAWRQHKSNCVSSSSGSSNLKELTKVQSSMVVAFGKNRKASLEHDEDARLHAETVGARALYRSGRRETAAKVFLTCGNRYSQYQQHLNAFHCFCAAAQYFEAKKDWVLHEELYIKADTEMKAFANSNDLLVGPAAVELFAMDLQLELLDIDWLRLSFGEYEPENGNRFLAFDLARSAIQRVQARFPDEVHLPEPVCSAYVALISNCIRSHPDDPTHRQLANKAIEMARALAIAPPLDLLVLIEMEDSNWTAALRYAQEAEREARNNGDIIEATMSVFHQVDCTVKIIRAWRKQHDSATEYPNHIREQLLTAEHLFDTALTTLKAYNVDPDIRQTDIIRSIQIQALKEPFGVNFHFSSIKAEPKKKYRNSFVWEK